MPGDPPDLRTPPPIARPRRPAPRRAPSSNSATLLALLGLLLIGGGLLALVALVLPQIAMMVLVIAGVFILPAAFHYLVWGWWLSRINTAEPSAAEEQVFEQEPFENTE
ncbi:MAG: hypothetical protein ACKV0T_01210 [Planctomycetales bacterium]